MKYRKWSNAGYRTLAWIQGTGTFALVLLGGAMKADRSDWVAKSNVLTGIVDVAQIYGWALLPALALATGLAGFLKKAFGPPWVWRTLHHFLSVFREDAFRHVKDDPEFHHRVTLFKYQPWRVCLRRWPWTGWLVAVERSGHTTHNKSIVYRAPDDADTAEGVAGRTWAARQVIVVKGLPNLRDTPTSDDFATYAEQTFLSTQSARLLKPTARSLCGIPVEVAGQPWGVIVLDSRHPDGVVNSEAAYRTFSKYVGKIVERI